ncbi:hypothetical protein [Niveispirillum cyanobacteriorum]|uniref:Uncharacterized protein n=1 Tax=Niveispirillum cyanobacteriorum TaxID=1612173 RepID=A0A2K9NDT3_9PROT|nr:hypothetical protein [Niveispirillum cyanobacteriorum]AUN31264.1 hypothetical protein C0V82_14230 [Niveispirillum cyanobacteriorum]GGE72808.1 hypothetical protein GCM10011317_32570 [Niveispirillum cyanobacteriorum]
MRLPAPVIELSLLLSELRGDRALPAERRAWARGVLVRVLAAFRGDVTRADKIDPATAKMAFDAVWDELISAGAHPADMTAWAADAAERNGPGRR